MKRFWITGAALVCMDRTRSVRRANLLIDDGVITQLTQRSPPRRDRCLKADGLFILPGFIQTHIHLCQTLFRNQAEGLELLDWLEKRIWPLEAAHTEVTLEASTLLGLHELLSTGTTCILDMGTVRHTHVIAETVERVGIRAVLGKCLMDAPTAFASLREPMKQALQEAVDLAARPHSSRVSWSLAPRFILSCTDTLLREVAVLARSSGMLIHTHACENKREISEIARLRGAPNLIALDRLGVLGKRTVLAHGVWISDLERKTLVQSGSAIAHCPSSNLKLASGIAPISALRAVGVRVGLGADGAPCNNNLNMFTEMRLAALLQKPEGGPMALGASDALAMATCEGASVLGLESSIGSIEIGKRADLIALDLNQPHSWGDLSLEHDAIASRIVYCADARNLAWTMVDGRVLARQGRVMGLDKQDVLRKCTRAQAKISRP